MTSFIAIDLTNGDVAHVNPAMVRFIEHNANIPDECDIYFADDHKISAKGGARDVAKKLGV